MGNFDLGASEEAFEEDNGDAYLNQPFLGRARLEEIVKAEYSDGEYPVIEVTFRCLGPNKVPNYDFDGDRLHTHAEFPFDREDFQVGEDEDMSSAQKQADRIAWILGYFMPEEVALQAVQISDADTVDEAWEQLRSQVTAAFEQYADTEKDVKIKVDATVYNGEARIQTPYYKGWIEDEDSDHTLNWSRSDQQDAKSWARAQDAEPESNGEMEPAGDEDWDW